MSFSIKSTPSTTPANQVPVDVSTQHQHPIIGIETQHRHPIDTQRHVVVSPSTNSDLLEAIASGYLAHDKIHQLSADRQSGGRGQHGRLWHSPIGNVYLSLYFPLTVPLSGLLSLMVGYCLTRLPVIERINQQRTQQHLPIIGVKWANDIGYYEYRAEDKDTASDTRRLNAAQPHLFHKLAGILIEPAYCQTDSASTPQKNTGRQLVGVVVGVGLNVNTAPALMTTPALNEPHMGKNATQKNSVCVVNEASSIQQLQGTTETIDPKMLYPDIAEAIGQAIALFHQPMAHPNFIRDYVRINLLNEKEVAITQSHRNSTLRDSAISTPTSISTSMGKSSPKNTIFKGTVIGINLDGSLRLRTEGGSILPIYTGRIELLSDSAF